MKRQLIAGIVITVFGLIVGAIEIYFNELESTESVAYIIIGTALVTTSSIKDKK